MSIEQRFMGVAGNAWGGPVSWAEAVTAITSIITMGAVVFAVVQVVFHNRQMHRDFESLYLQRYWHITDRFSGPSTVSGERDPHDLKAIHAYLELSNDQVSLRSLGRITDDTWRFWEEAIYEFISSGPYKEAVKEDDRDNYQHLWDMLEHHDEGPHEPKNHYDPLRRSKLHRMFTGL